MKERIARLLRSPANSTDHEWEEFGERDPYYGVLSDERFRSKRLDAAARAAFFDSGERHVASVLSTIRQKVEASFVPRRAVDFGCGVGRLVVPLSTMATEVVGCDVAQSMLAEARRNCEERGIANVSFVRSDDDLSALKGTFDLVHACMVFQHIPPKRGEQLIERLLERLEPGGVAALHITYSPHHARRRFISMIRDHVPVLKHLLNVRAGRNFNAPEMRMYSYDLHRIFALLAGLRFDAYWVEQHDQPGRPAVMLYARRQPLATS